ncbi:hypothetical protein C8T65DRAFT_746804 [Cerioporus squamosus]|nr:hypothetical protein C8T65DRAFT_746804 [Cerioporus squamosus]
MTQTRLCFSKGLLRTHGVKGAKVTTSSQGGCLQPPKFIDVTVVAWTEDNCLPEVLVIPTPMVKNVPKPIKLAKISATIKRIDLFVVHFLDFTKEEWEHCIMGDIIWFHAKAPLIFVCVYGVLRCSHFGYYLEQAYQMVLDEPVILDVEGMANRHSYLVTGTGTRVVRGVTWLEDDENPVATLVQLDTNAEVCVSKIVKAYDDSQFIIYTWEFGETQWTLRAPGDIKVGVSTSRHLGRKLRKLELETTGALETVDACVGTNARPHYEEGNVADKDTLSDQVALASRSMSNACVSTAVDNAMSAKEVQGQVSAQTVMGEKVVPLGGDSKGTEVVSGVQWGIEPEEGSQADSDGPLKLKEGDVIYARPVKEGPLRRYISAEVVERFFWEERKHGRENLKLPRELRACLPRLLNPRVRLICHPWKPAKVQGFPESVCKLAHVGLELRTPMMPQGCEKCRAHHATFIAWVCYICGKTGKVMVKCNLWDESYLPEDQPGPDEATQEAINKAWQEMQAQHKEVKEAERKAQKGAEKAKKAAEKAKKAVEKAEEARQEGERKAAQVEPHSVAAKRSPAPMVGCGQDREEIDRLRACEHRRQQGLAASSGGSIRQTQNMPPVVDAKLLFWIQPGQPAEEHEVTVDTHGIVHLNDLPVVRAHRAIEPCTFLVWDGMKQKWECSQDEPVDVTGHNTTILARVDYPGACQGSGTELHVVQDLMDPDLCKNTQVLCEAQRQEITNRHMTKGQVWLVFCSPKRRSWSTWNCVMAKIDVWVHDQTQWSTQRAWSSIPVPAHYDTILVCKHNLGYNPYLSLKIAALDGCCCIHHLLAGIVNSRAGTPIKSEAHAPTQSNTEARASTPVNNRPRVEAGRDDVTLTKQGRRANRKSCPHNSAEYIDIDALPDIAPVKIERVTCSQLRYAADMPGVAVKTERREEGKQHDRTQEVVLLQAVDNDIARGKCTRKQAGMDNPEGADTIDIAKRVKREEHVLDWEGAMEKEASGNITFDIKCLYAEM